MSKEYPGKGRQQGTLALTDINLEIRESEFLTLLGPSGCGKTTILHMIASLIPLSTGEIRFDGGRKNEGPLTSIVWQENALFPWRTVKKNIVFGLEVRGVTEERQKAVCRDLLDLVNLKGFENHFPHQLSGGMRQRVNLARAWANDPEVLLMDEPFAALDAQTKYLLSEELVRIWEKSQKTVVYITHSIEEALLLSDRVAVMTARPGRIKEILAVDLPRPRTSEVLADPKYDVLFQRIWSILKEEVKITQGAMA